MTQKQIHNSPHLTFFLTAFRKLIAFSWSIFLRLLFVFPFLQTIVLLQDNSLKSGLNIQAVLAFFAGKPIQNQLVESDYLRAVSVLIIVISIIFEIAERLITKQRGNDWTMFRRGLVISFLGWLSYGIAYATIKGDPINALYTIGFFVGTAAFLFAQLLSIRIAKAVIASFNGETITYDKIMK